MNQLSIFPTPEIAGSIAGHLIPQDFLKAGRFVIDFQPERCSFYRFTDWHNRYGVWSKDYKVKVMGYIDDKLVIGQLESGRIDEFAPMQLFPWIEK